MKKEIYLFAKLNKTHLSSIMLSNQLKCFTIQTSTNNEFTSADEDLNLLIKKNQSKLAIKNEVMQNDNYMILSISLI